eukprot:3888398-Rhodomonas_salina.3
MLCFKLNFAGVCSCCHKTELICSATSHSHREDSSHALAPVQASNSTHHGTNHHSCHLHPQAGSRLRKVGFVVFGTAV